MAHPNHANDVTPQSPKQRAVIGAVGGGSIGYNLAEIVMWMLNVVVTRFIGPCRLDSVTDGACIPSDIEGKAITILVALFGYIGVRYMDRDGDGVPDHHDAYPDDPARTRIGSTPGPARNG